MMRAKTIKSTLSVYLGRHFHLAIASFGTVDVNLPEYEKVSEVTNAPQHKFQIKDKRFLYPSTAKASKRDISVNSVHYRLTPDCLVRMAKNGAVNEKDDVVLKKKWTENVQLPTKFINHQTAFSEMLEEFESMQDLHLSRINTPKHFIGLLNNDTRVVHSARYRAGPTTRKFAALEFSQMIIGKVIDPVTMEWVASIMCSPKKDGSLFFCVEQLKLNAARRHDLYSLPGIDERIEGLREATVFSVLDATSANWKIEKDEHNCNRIALFSNHRLFRFIWVLFAVKSVPATV